MSEVAQKYRDEKRAKLVAKLGDHVQCDAMTTRTSVYDLHYVGNAGGQCMRRATYTDGKHFRCTQHAKEPATVLRKATNKIMPGFRRLGVLVDGE